MVLLTICSRGYPDSLALLIPTGFADYHGIADYVSTWLPVQVATLALWLCRFQDQGSQQSQLESLESGSQSSHVEIKSATP